MRGLRTNTGGKPMSSDVKSNDNKPLNLLLIALAAVGGVLAIVSLFVYWVDICTVFSYSFFEIPYTMKATAIKVVEGSTDIPDDWHIYTPVIAGVCAILGTVILAVSCFVRKGSRALAACAVILGVGCIVSALTFSAWTFDVTYDVPDEVGAAVNGLAAALAGGDIPTASTIITQLGLDPAVVLPQISSMPPEQMAATVAELQPGNTVVVGEMHVIDVVAIGYDLCLIGGVLVTIAGCIGVFRSKE